MREMRDASSFKKPGYDDRLFDRTSYGDINSLEHQHPSRNSSIPDDRMPLNSKSTSSYGTTSSGPEVCCCFSGQRVTSA